jgi:hypothetical protein
MPSRDHGQIAIDWGAHFDFQVQRPGLVVVEVEMVPHELLEAGNLDSDVWRLGPSKQRL